MHLLSVRETKVVCKQKQSNVQLNLLKIKRAITYCVKLSKERSVGVLHSAKVANILLFLVTRLLVVLYLRVIYLLFPRAINLVLIIN